MRVHAAIALAAAIAAGSGCGGAPSPSTPTAPVTVPAAQASTIYSGLYRVTSCGSLCGWVGPSWPFSIAVGGTNDAPTATIRTEPWGLEATLTGRRQPDGVLILSGTSPGDGVSISGAAIDAVVREDLNGSLTGTFSYAVTRVDAPSMSVSGQIVSASRSAAAALPTEFAGTWVGSGRDERLCTSDWGCVDPTVNLTLVRQGAGYVGLAQVRGVAQLLSIGVAGQQAGASLVLRGSIPKAPGQLLDIAQDLRLTVRMLSSGEMVGDYELVQTEGTGTRRFRGAVLPRRAKPFGVSNQFNGSWYGWILHESCTGDTNDCNLLHSSNFEISLSQSGSQVTGMYATQFAMTGTASGATLVLEGSRTVSDGCVTQHSTPCSERLRLEITGIDEWGVLSGTGSHTFQWRYSYYTKSGRLWSFARLIQ